VVANDTARLEEVDAGVHFYRPQFVRKNYLDAGF